MSKTNLDERKVTAIIALTDGEPVAEASRLANVSRQTIYDWMIDCPQFQRVLNRRLLAITHLKVMLSLPHIETSISTIVEIRDDMNNKPSVRLQASKDLLEITSSLASYSINAELSDLRQQLGGDDAET
ncbi:MAG: helix-turn-helix domain-containing protein [Pleurocapsa sp. CRU_1_2]|nr:helix-turn-helix domain-containing protein [Pleurocapsa sp. CRU_1_2]